ncbi:endonuclease/exonuclease/phosphatase family protein [Erythrobacter sp. WG]|uniref:endonuclease/exonuclease/phosphatase family protein n=1 Tax=Erythrobacter sp. WG TaxID=2985510 RepID=UPI00226D4BFB|nr:endonuclease/exonuclease/phosphatase family protein [Erythrobacter sp. WG]MCX9147935.1 endonuclease/exonuclease/phosphatase family protein [Erythrobacter sp. WG]
MPGIPRTRRAATTLAAVCLAGLAFAAAGCVSYPAERRSPLAAPPAGPAPATLSVMTYNIEGLTWPARTGRAPFLAAMTEEFARMEAAGVLPDVIVFQEAFSTAALSTAASTPHPNLAIGPRATARSGLPRSRDPVLRRRNILRGEWGVRFTGSGLAIASRYPILAAFSQPYGPTSCAGWDCLANKSAMLVRIAVPGLADPVEIATTHMNSQRASKAPPEKHLAAHLAQSAELANFLDRVSRADSPLILGGDFNMRRSPQRFDAFETQHGFQLARRHCLKAAAGRARPACEIRLSFDGDAPWLDTQDLQIYDDGARIALRPVRIEAWFDGEDAGGRLSDHDAYIVTYAILPAEAPGAQADD